MTATNSNHKHVTKHGVMLDVLGLGVLLTGVSGIGKSEIALGLITREHKLIADDAVHFKNGADGKIIGYCSELLQDYLEVRGLGILNIRAMFGDAAICKQKNLDLIVNMIQLSAEEMKHIDRLNGLHRQCDILGVSFPEVSIPVAPGRNIAILIEGAVRNHVLKQQGYDAGAEFIVRQQAVIERGQDDR